MPDDPVTEAAKLIDASVCDCERAELAAYDAIDAGMAALGGSRGVLREQITKGGDPVAVAESLAYLTAAAWVELAIRDGMHPRQVGNAAREILLTQVWGGDER